MIPFQHFNTALWIQNFNERRLTFDACVHCYIHMPTMKYFTILQKNTKLHACLLQNALRIKAIHCARYPPPCVLIRVH